jgi:hypothetical protein
VVDLAQKVELECKLTVDELLKAVINHDEVQELVKRPVEYHCLLLPVEL